jgi:hypothetical protein
MTPDGKSTSSFELGLGHLARAIELFQQHAEDLGSPLAASFKDKRSLPPVAEPAGATGPAAKAAAFPLAVLKAALQQERIEQLHAGHFATNDILEVWGSLGAEENRAWRVNDKLPQDLQAGEHTVLLILANFGRYVFDPARAAKKHLPLFLPVKSIMAILDDLTAEGRPLFGRWDNPTYANVYRWVSQLRAKLNAPGGSRDLLQTGPRGDGYRISTPPLNLILDDSQEDWRAFWFPVLDAALLAPREVERRQRRGRPR